MSVIWINNSYFSPPPWVETDARLALRRWHREKDLSDSQLAARSTSSPPNILPNSSAGSMQGGGGGGGRRGGGGVAGRATTSYLLLVLALCVHMRWGSDTLVFSRPCNASWCHAHASMPLYRPHEPPRLRNNVHKSIDRFTCRMNVPRSVNKVKRKGSRLAAPIDRGHSEGGEGGEDHPE